jgi:hypothetical protein
MDFENNLGFLMSTFRWKRCALNGQPGNYRLCNVGILSSFGPYKVGDEIPVVDVSLISGKIDIHRENKDLLTFDIKPNLTLCCATCHNSGQIRVGRFDPEWDNCPDCTPRRGVR